MTIKLIFEMSVLDKWLLSWSYTILKTNMKLLPKGVAAQKQEWSFKISHTGHHTLCSWLSYDTVREGTVYSQLVLVNHSHTVQLLTELLHSNTWSELPSKATEQSPTKLLPAGSIIASKLYLSKISIPCIGLKKMQRDSINVCKWIHW